jgi:hypothetical protein
MMDDDFESINDHEESRLSELEIRTMDLENELRELLELRDSYTRQHTEPHDQTEEVPRRTMLRATPRPRPGEGAARSQQEWPTRGYPAQPPGTHPREALHHLIPADEDEEIPAAVINTGPRPSRTGARREAPRGQDRTQALIDRGRHNVAKRRMPRFRTLLIGVAALIVLIIIAVVFFGPSPSFPASVATVKTEITQACENPNVASEPGQVNFACAKDTSQILWVFALMTSNDNPAFTDPKTGRQGLEPITPTQGGEVAWSLDLHHPYNPADPVDSLAVAARAINNIIGGATLTSSTGKPAVQAGLESSPANCARYTGSAAVVTRAGFPAICAHPITSATGQAALVSDTYKQWVTGATSEAAYNVSVLFENASNPGNPQVQAILKTLPGAS